MKKNREFYGLNQNDRLLFISGVPLSYLKKPTHPQDLNFAVTSYETKEKQVRINPQRQQQVLLEVIENVETLGEAGLYAVGSSPTEQAGYGLAAMLSSVYFKSVFKEGHIPEVKWIDLGRPDWEFLQSQEPCDLCVIHGLTTTSETKKYDRARDFIHRTEFCTTVLVANTDNILSFMVSRIGISPDVVWQLSKTTHEVFL